MKQVCGSSKLELARRWVIKCILLLLGFALFALRCYLFYAFSFFDPLDLGRNMNPGGAEGSSVAAEPGSPPSASPSQDASSVARGKRPLELSQDHLWENVDRLQSKRRIVTDSDWMSDWVTRRENRLADLLNENRETEHMRPLAPYRLQAVVEYLEDKYSLESLPEIIGDIEKKGVGSSFYTESKLDRSLPKEAALKASILDVTRGKNPEP